MSRLARRPTTPRPPRGRAGRLERYQLLVCDELGYIPFEPQAANLMFMLVPRRYQRASLIVRSDKRVSAWGEIVGDDATAAAMIDRLVHHAERLSLTVDTYRLKNHNLSAPPTSQAAQTDWPPGSGAAMAATRAASRTVRLHEQLPQLGQFSTGATGQFAIRLDSRKFAPEIDVDLTTIISAISPLTLPVPPATLPTMALPTFFIIGAPKAGTTSLHYYLDQHPQIQMSVNKEPRFFAGPENGVPYAPGKVDSLDEYEQLFDSKVNVRGEASTDYAIYPRREGAPERIKEMIPEARFLYLVRDPVARTISHYRMRVAFLGERRPLAEALSDFSDPRSPYIWPSLYASQLERYLRQFAHEKIMVIDQAELLAERRTTLRHIFTFLSVDDTIDSSRFDEVLSRSREWRAYSPGYLRLVNNVVAPSLKWIPKDIRRSARGALDRILWPSLETPTLDDGLRARLEDLYAVEAERLRALTGKSFPSWSV